MVTHNWWHTALFALALGDTATVLRMYDERVWGVEKSYSQDQINAISLLARLELVGVDVGQRWQDLGRYLAPRPTTKCCLFWTCSTCTAWHGRGCRRRIR